LPLLRRACFFNVSLVCRDALFAAFGLPNSAYLHLYRPLRAQNTSRAATPRATRSGDAFTRIFVPTL